MGPYNVPLAILGNVTSPSIEKFSFYLTCFITVSLDSFPSSPTRLSLPDCTFSVHGVYLLLASDVTFMPICSIVYLYIYPAGICRSPARASTCEAPGCDGEQTQLWVSFQLACGRHVISKLVSKENKGEWWVAALREVSTE